MIIVILCFAIVLTTLFSWGFWNSIEFPIDKSNAGIFVWSTFMTFGLLLSLTAYIGYFSLNIYPKIPSVLGGGEPKEVRIVLSNQNNNNFIRSTLSYDEEKGVAPPHLLLTSNERIFVIIDKDNNVIELPRNNISMVIYNTATDTLLNSN